MKDFSNYKFDLVPSPVDPKDYQVEAIYHTQVTLPEKFDHIKELTPIRDQGSQGSCSAMTAALLKEWEERKELGYADYMSPQFVYNLRSNSGEGMIPRDTMSILHKKGIIPEKLYPYGTMRKITSDELENAKNFRIAGYAQVNSVFGAKAAIMDDGPLYIGLPVYNPNKQNFWKQEYIGQPMLGGHAVAIVGWNEEAFIIRNSWGPEWGYDGYCYYPYDDWGTHWEIWTTIDGESSMERLQEMLDGIKPKKRCFSFWRK